MADRKRRGDPEGGRHQLDAPPHDVLGGLEAVDPGSQAVQPVDHGRQVGPGQQGGDQVGRNRDEPETDPRDHRQRPLAAAQQPGQVVAGVVLLETGEMREHGTIGEDRLQPGHLPAHGAVAQHVHPAGVGRGHAPDGGRVASGQIDGHAEPGPAGVGLGGGQRDAGAGGQLAGGGVHRVEGIEARRAEHDRGPGVVRDRPADQSGVAALGERPARRWPRRPGLRRRPARSWPGGQPCGPGRGIDRSSPFRSRRGGRRR